MLDADIRIGTDLPHSIAYTINGEPGDLCDCSKGTFVEFFFFWESKFAEFGFEGEAIGPY